MKANDTQIFKYLEGSKCFAVPLFQRTYSWERVHVETLWHDVKDTKDSGDSAHFFGSFVTMPIPSSASGISKYVVIDGQQRLVTISIFLAALRSRIAEINPKSELKDAIYEQYLINKYAEESDDKYKVVPTQADRNILSSIIENPKFDPSGEHLITKAYAFLKKMLLTINDFEELKELKNTILNKFLVVDICLDEDDDPYLIFESLNAKGSPLTQADLVRNYLFMRISEKSQQQVYDTIWFPMQQRLKDYLEDFIRHYLARGGSIPNFNKIYATLKDNADANLKTEEEIIGFMKGLARYSEYYFRFLHPVDEPNGELRTCFEKLNILEVSTSYPLLLNLYDDYANSGLSSGGFVELLQTIETYIVRRAVCGVPTNALNKYFPTVYSSLNKKDIIGSFKNNVKKESGTSKMPDDKEFGDSLRQRELYGSKILRYLLEEIEKHDNKEVVKFDELQIEHIMPQTLSDAWKKQLGENWELIHKKYLDTIGNLTLSGYNPEYSNRIFIEKRDMEKGFKNSGLQLNRDLATLDTWGEKEITDRATSLSKVALSIWTI